MGDGRVTANVRRLACGQRRALLCLALMLLVVLSGCGSGRPGGKAAPTTATPAKLLDRIGWAFAEDDRAVYLSCFTGPGEAVSVFALVYDLNRAGAGLRKQIAEGQADAGDAVAPLRTLMPLAWGQPLHETPPRMQGDVMTAATVLWDSDLVLVDLSSDEADAGTGSTASDGERAGAWRVDAGATLGSAGVLLPAQAAGLYQEYYRECLEAVQQAAADGGTPSAVDALQSRLATVSARHFSRYRKLRQAAMEAASDAGAMNSEAIDRDGAGTPVLQGLAASE